MADFPQLTYGKVVGRFLAAVGDGSDAGSDPDAVPMTGSVTFTPSAEYVLVASGSPDPVTVLPTPITVDLDSDGYLAWRPGVERGVHLIATDDPSMNPTGWTWKVSFNVKHKGSSVSRAPYNISLPAGSSLDLTLYSPVPESGGTGTIRGPKGDSWVKVLTQAEYDALTPPDPNTLYFITA